MPATPGPRGRRLQRWMVLAALGVVVVLVALLTPERDDGRGDSSSRSTAGGGARMFFELAQRMGWRASQRDVPFEHADATTVEVELSPNGGLSEREVHRLLEHVRAGGGLVFDASGNDDLVDSLGLLVGSEQFAPTVVDPGECPPTSGVGERAELAFPPGIHDLRWRRPPPGEVTMIGTRGLRGSVPFGVAFPLGRGRVAAMGSSDIFTNDAIRRCGWGADVAVARALEYVRPAGGAAVLEFDEYHHGYGVHPGSLSAVATYLSRTASGRFLATALIAGVLLLFASAPRPVPPRDAARIARRSPLEHADALARAYADVGATRTAMQRLVSGMRRRVGRMVHVPSSAADAEFLDAVARRVPDAPQDMRTVQRALNERIDPRELVASGAALQTLEQRIERTSSSTT